jgi:hypothetical protein
MVCPSPENNPTASAHAFLELFSFCTMAAVIGRFIYRNVGTSPVHVTLIKIWPSEVDWPAWTDQDRMQRIGLIRA